MDIFFNVLAVLAVYGFLYVVFVKTIKVKKLWWLPVCVGSLLVFITATMMQSPEDYKNIYYMSIKWGFFGFFVYSFDMARKSWPKGW